MMTRTCCHKTEDEVLAYVAGEMGETDALAMAEHLGECHSCCEEAAEFTALSCALPECCAGEAIRWHVFDTPFGRMFAAATSKGLVRLTWRRLGAGRFVTEMEERFPGRPIVRDPEAFVELERQLQEYFAGERSEFDVSLDFSALTNFEKSVLNELLAISFGQLVPYSELAERIGKPKAARAVGNAVGANPIPIVVPCHRVVRLDGSLGGYGGGPSYKRRLLKIEGRDDFLRAS